MSGSLQGLLKFMKDSGYTCTEEWLAACVEWVQENYNPVTEALLRQQAFEQWKDADLMEMESCCLPTNLESQKVTTLKGKFGLQVNSIQDIGESSYNQWKKIKKLESENTNVAATDTTEVKNSWAPKPLRCLYLTLTDGSQTIYGMELKPLPALNLTLRPGTKVLVMGPVECRRGILQLQPQNVKIIGGEVESLVEKNSTESLLRQALHNPPERDPLPSQSSNNRNIPQPASPGDTAVTGEFPDDDGFPAFPEDDDEIFMGIDETELIQSSTANPSNLSTLSGRRNTESFRNAETQRLYDYQLPDSSEMGPPVSRSNTIPQPPKRQLSSTSTSSTDSISSTRSGTSTQARPSGVTKSRAFQPPAKVQKSESSTSISSAKPSTSRSVVQTKISDFTSSNVGFTSATTLIPPAKVKPKQLKIDGYMKPMPVFIKPPTPKGNSNKHVTVAVTQSNQNREDPFEDSSEDIFESSILQDEGGQEFDEGLMDLIEDSIDNEMRRLEDEHAEQNTSVVFISDSPTPPFLPCASSSPKPNANKKVNPPTGIVKPTTSRSITGEESSPVLLPISVSKNPYIYLKQVLDQWDLLLEQERPVVKVKACVATVVSNIRGIEGVWNLEVSINDGTGSMNCRISPDILSEIIGFNPVQMKKMKASKTPEAKEKIVQGMKALTSTLVHLNAIFEIELGDDPILTHIQELSSYHISALKERLSHL